ncbi:MAG: tetratricopeptide repeat protein [Saprospiraceae bacterium]|nr:tetratricopeptide repeat protein [Saprospiraceae bacterium]MDW8484754.1 tetratricopeptide repeat protein [Saprospiraceae bacterium]
MNIYKWLLICVSCTVLATCGEQYDARIQVLEKKISQAADPKLVADLIALYQEAVQRHPERYADNARYLTRAAELKFTHVRDNVGAVRLAVSAIKDYGSKADVAEAAGLLARIWRLYKNRATPDLSREPDDIDLMRFTLEQNTRWIDSCLARLDRQLLSTAEVNRQTAEKFLQTAEGYAILIEDPDPNKAARLYVQAASLARSIGEPRTSLRLYYHVAEQMPQQKSAPLALFMMGILYEDDLKELDNAKRTYEEFLRRYPNDPEYADDVKAALKNLGTPLEELIKRFEQNKPQ